jgi:hypothetical protein
MRHHQKRSSHRILSCLPCRQHKLRCDRRVPCRTCCRYNREDECKEHPASTTSLRPSTSRQPVQLSSIAARPTDPSSQTAMTESRDRIPSEKSYETCELSGETHVCQLGKLKRLSYHRGIACRAGNNKHVLWIPNASAPNLSGTQNILDTAEIQDLQKMQLLLMLPSQKQCDLLFDYFFEAVNWIYQVNHEPSVRRWYSHFWLSTVTEVDLTQLSLLFAMISISILVMPLDLSTEMGFESIFREHAHIWHSASQQALICGNTASKPCLLQIQIFLTTQSYWLETKNIEILNR